MQPRPGGSHPATLLAWVAGLGAVAGTTAAVALSLASGDAVSWKPLLLPLVWVVPGVLLAAARPWLAHGWLLLAVAGCFVAVGLVGALLGLASPGDPGAAWGVWFVDRASAYVVPATLAALLLLPDGRLPAPVWRPVLVAAVGAQVVLVTAFCLVAGPAAGPDSSVAEPLRDLPNPLGVLPETWSATVAGLDLLVLQVPLLLVPAAFWHRWRLAGPEQRPRLASLLVAAVVFVAVVVLGHLGWPAAADLLDVAASALLIAVLVGTALGRDGVEVVVHRTAVWVTLTLLIAGGYVAVTAAAAAVGAGLPPLGAGTVAAVLALALLPVRGALQRLLGRLLYGDRHDPLAAVSTLAATAHGAGSTAEVAHEVAAAVARSLRVPWVEVSASGHTARHGRRTPYQRPYAVALVGGDGQPGALTLGLDAGRRWTAEDDRLLDVIARQAGIALRAAALAESVARSRDRVVDAREAERRRVGRDLHDDLGPTIASLGMELAALREVVDSDPTAADDRLDRLERLAHDALADVRRLARELRPPSLDQLGLVEALCRDAESLGLELGVSSPRPLVLAPGSEVAAYRIGQQALANVAAHAGTSCVELELTLTGAGLRLVIGDRGAGLPALPVEGVGLVGMRERAEEVGGRCVVRPRDGGGTEVVALLPVGVTEPAR